MKSFMDYHTLDEIIDMEKQIIHKRMTFYKQMLEVMFMQGAGPADEEFIQIQSIYGMWKGSYEKLNGLSDQDLSGGKKRW